MAHPDRSIEKIDKEFLMAHGLITARIACQLRDEYEPKGFQILSGHGDKTTDPPDRIGKLRAYYSDRYGAASLLAVCVNDLRQLHSEFTL